MKKKRVIKFKGEEVAIPSSASSSSSSSRRKGAGLILKRPNHPRIRFSVGRRGDGGDLEAIALPLGMSIAAIFAQVLERHGATTERMSADYLSTICSSTVAESLADVFGDKSDSFIRNFNKSFRSTLRTLRFINQSSAHNHQVPHLDVEEEVEENAPSISVDRSLAIYGSANQLACVIPNTSSSANQSIVSNTFEKSFLEQFYRSNELRENEIGLREREIELREREIDLTSEKLVMDTFKAAFDAGKFKNQVEETRHGELQRNCVDCLVAGMFVMSSSLLYGAYVFAYDRITEATKTCFPSAEEPKSSWWMPKHISTFNSGLSSVTCHVQVGIRMSFGVLMIVTMAYLLLQRSVTTTKQTMPITFILVLLGGGCGVAGKLCVDTLGGNGYSWLIHWELLCSIHFLSNVWTSVLFFILYGPVNVVPGRMKCSTLLFPYWIWRLSFYSIVLLLLPLLCGFSPFASIGEWKDHFKLMLYDFATSEDDASSKFKLDL